MSAKDVTQGFLCPWGVSHKTIVRPTNRFNEGRREFNVETHYYIRIKLPKYVIRLNQAGLLPNSEIRKLFTQFESKFNRVSNGETFVALHCYWDTGNFVEVAVKLTVYDELYHRARIKYLYERFKEYLDEVLDDIRDILVAEIVEKGNYMGYKLSVHGQICFARSP